MHRLWGFAVLLAAGCLRENVQYCKNGALCPEPLVCTENAGEPYCGNRDMVDQCMGKPDESFCMFGDEPRGYCLASICTQCDSNLSFCRYDTWTPMRVVLDGVQVGSDLKGVWATGPNDVFVVGRQGVFAHWNGRAWSKLPTIQSDVSYESIAGTAPDNLFAATIEAVGGSRVHRFNGTGWTAQTNTAPAQTPAAVSVPSASSAFVVGALGEVGRYNGTMWVYPSPTPTTVTLAGVWAKDDNTAVAVGNSGTAVRYNAGTWTAEPTGTNHLFRDVAAAGSFELAVGRAVVKAPVATKYDNAMWTETPMPPGIGAIELFGVWVVSPTDAYAVGESLTILHYDGATWTSMPVENTPSVVLNEIAATTTDVFAVGGTGTVLRLSR